MYTTTEAQLIPEMYHCNVCGFSTDSEEVIQQHVTTHQFKTLECAGITFTYCPTEHAFKDAHNHSSCLRGVWLEPGWYASFNNEMLHVSMHKACSTRIAQTHQEFLDALEQFEKKHNHACTA